MVTGKSNLDCRSYCFIANRVVIPGSQFEGRLVTKTFPYLPHLFLVLSQLLIDQL